MSQVRLHPALSHIKGLAKPRPGMAVFLETEAAWLDHIHQVIQTVFLNQLTHRERFCELHTDRNGVRKPVGIWGWNTWCGIHDMTPLVGESVHSIMRNTFDEGLNRTERGTGLLPHAILIDSDGRIGYCDGKERVEYRTYSGIHGEDYCLDNIICWAKMILEFFLYTRDREWFTLDKLARIERSTDYILDDLRSAYNPALIESGIEGDWTENTNWHADNSNNNVCMVQCLDQLVQVESIFGRDAQSERYQAIGREIRSHFCAGVDEGGFWLADKGFFIHGNDGAGKRTYGERYFESTANYFSILWDVASPRQADGIWRYLDLHPEIELPYPVLTNHNPRDSARRMNYGHTVTDGDIWLTLGSHAAAARLRSGHRSKATEMYRAIVEYERREGTIHNNIYPDGTSNLSWSPEIGNYGSLFTPLVEGVLGIRPIDQGLLVQPLALEGMRHLRTMIPLSYAGKAFHLDISWKAGRRPSVVVNGRKQRTTGNGYLLPPDFDDGSVVKMSFR